MMDEVKVVVLDCFRSEFIAQVVVGILKDEGIAAHVLGENLQDGFASSQRILGNLAACVFVEERRIEEARRILAAARAAGHLCDDEPDADGAGDAAGA
ncbi:MAG: DUF2007 domain-containing protein [Planctomycetes bacterium]|nr:DUF2007 domain-containing protein [Planctomycetota bacterium]